MPSSLSLHSPQQKKLREVLIGARKKADIAQAELAARLKRPQSFVAKYELGERRVDVVEFVEIARALGCDPFDLLGGYLDAIQTAGA